VCDDLDIPKYAMFSVPKKDLKMKDRADLLEAFIGALYVDKDLVNDFSFASSSFSNFGEKST
jgi:ribonuclease-3